MFNLPDILYAKQEKEFLPYVYLHVSDETTRKSRLNFNKPCISIILSGEKRIFGDGKYDSFRTGDLVLFKPGNYLGYEVIEGEQKYASLMIFFDPQNIPAQPQRLANDKFEIHRADEYLLHFGRSCQLLWQNAKMRSDETLHTIKFQEFLHYAMLSARDIFSFFSPAVGSRVESFKDCIERCRNATLSVGEIAFLCNMSLSSFKRNFETVYHESPGKWLKRKRLEQAAMLIKLHNKNPTEIFDETGYADYSSFSHSFKKQFGVGPKEYKQL